MDEDERGGTDGILAHCAQCGHEWRLAWKLPMPVSRAVKAMKGFVAAGCPQCGAFGKDVLAGPTPAPDDRRVE